MGLSRGNLQLHNARKGYCYHFVIRVDLELHDRTSVASRIRLHRLEVLHHICHLRLHQRVRAFRYHHHRAQLFTDVQRPYCSASRLTVWAFFPETKGRKLEEMDIYFTNMPIFVPGSKYVEEVDQYSRENELRAGACIPRLFPFIARLFLAAHPCSALHP